MDELNKLRLLAGVKIDHSREITKKQQVTEAREVPRRKSELSPRDAENIKKRIQLIGKAINHLKSAVEALEDAPAIDFMGDVPRYINEIEDILADGEGGGLVGYYGAIIKDKNSFDRKASKDRREEEEMISDDLDGMVEDEEAIAAMREGAAMTQNVIDSAMNAVRQAIAYCKKEHSEEQDHDIKDMHTKDADRYARVLKNMRDGNDDAAKYAYKNMDTAARDYLASPSIVKKKGDRKAASRYFDYDLLHEAKDEVTAKGPTKFPEKDEMHDKKHLDKKAEEIDKVVDQNDATSNPKKVVKQKTDESMMYYTDHFADFKDDEQQAINVADNEVAGDELSTDSHPEMDKDESPCQLNALGQQSMTDFDTDMNVPRNIIDPLKREMEQARKDADFQGLSTANKEAKVFYNDLANAFEKLIGHLEKGSIHDMKQAQIFASSLMGPMLHKIPAETWDYIVNGGKSKSLKDYLKKSPEAKTGPINTLK